MTRLHLLAVVGLVSCVTVSLSHADLRGQDQKQKAGYGGEPSAVQYHKEPPKLDDVIDTDKKPAPAKDYVDVLVTSWNEGGTGGFLLSKDGKGLTIARGVDRQGQTHHVAATLEGYGSTREFWVYEVKDFKIGDKKVYHAFYKSGPDISSAWRVLASSGVDEPKDLRSFRTLGWATRGEKEPK